MTDDTVTVNPATGEVLTEGEPSAANPEPTAGRGLGPSSPSVSTDLVPTAGPSNNLIGVTEPAAYLERSRDIADNLMRVVEEKKLFENIQGRRFITVEAWKYLGSMLGVYAIPGDPEWVKGAGGGWKVTAEARTMNGALVGRATALCTRSERRWDTADEHDVLAMAQTRAMRNALKGPLSFIVQLAGLEDAGDQQRTPAMNQAFHAKLGELDRDYPRAEGDPPWRDEIKRWGHDRGYPQSTANWTVDQMGAAIDELERWHQSEGIPF